jgi:transposase
MEAIPRLTSTEWRLIKSILPPGRSTRRRHDDRAIVDALFYCEAVRCSLEGVPHQYNIRSRTLRTRQSRWRSDGTWPRLLATGEPAIARMRREINYGQEDLLAECARVFGWDQL